jgi:hypothetical protein
MPAACPSGAGLEMVEMRPSTRRIRASYYSSSSPESLSWGSPLLAFFSPAKTFFPNNTNLEHSKQNTILRLVAPNAVKLFTQSCVCCLPPAQPRAASYLPRSDAHFLRRRLFSQCLRASRGRARTQAKRAKAWPPRDHLTPPGHVCIGNHH